MVSPNGAQFEGWFRDGLAHGDGILTWPDGGKFIGKYVDGKVSLVCEELSVGAQKRLKHAPRKDVRESTAVIWGHRQMLQLVGNESPGEGAIDVGQQKLPNNSPNEMDKSVVSSGSVWIVLEMMLRPPPQISLKRCENKKNYFMPMSRFS